jgi:RNA polymerase sigma factor (sigma-70 family)
VQVQGERNQGVAAALMQGLRAGSSQAWATLYDQLAPGIHRFAVSCLSGDAETAEDVVVETLADAARGIARFDPQKSSLSAWIYGIARRVVQTELRKRARRKSPPAWAHVSFEDLAEPSEREDLGARTAARLDAQTRIAGLGSLLSDAETELLTLSSIEELPVREIGRVVGRSEQATQMLLHRARQKVRRTAIEGTLVVQGNECRWDGSRYWLRPGTQWFEGISDSRRGDETGHHTVLSPAGDEIVYDSTGSSVTVWPLASDHIWKAKRDGSDAVNLSGQAGLRGVNCYPTWSPDGTMIAFLHWDEPGGEAVEPGEIWAIKADGSEARRVVPKAILPASGVAWSPDGSCLLCGGVAAVPAAVPTWLDLWGRHVEVVPATTSYADWSPDGSKLAVIRRKRGRAEGEVGWWNQLVLTKADGSAPKVLVEQFIADAELGSHRPSAEELELEPAFDWRQDFLHWAGPAEPTWSPGGDKIAFLAALPLLDGEADLKQQIDAWVYDLVTRRLTKLTHDSNVQLSLSWR